jgi:predicted Zn-dependent protease with MMP-like domain
MARSPDRELWIPRKRFEAIVAEAIDSIPDDFRGHLENVAVVVEDEPDAETLLDLELDPEEDSLYGPTRERRSTSATRCTAAPCPTAS